MRRRLIAVLAIALSLPGAAIQAAGPVAGARPATGAAGDDDHAQFAATAGIGLAAIVGPKTSPAPPPLGTTMALAPLVAPPCSEGLGPLGTGRGPAVETRRHRWLQRLRC